MSDRQHTVAIVRRIRPETNPEPPVLSYLLNEWMIRPRVILLGSGFGAFSFLKRIDTRRYDVTVVSPRNYFLFTPLLPSSTVGTVEFRSIIESIRLARRGQMLYQANALAVQPESNTLECESVLDQRRFTLSYDHLVIAVGAVVNTYGIPGVAEHGLLLKDLADARAIRQGIIECFERASQPDKSDEERRRLLHFVVVGGGPTGVEFAAEMHDFLEEDLRRSYPRLAPLVRITLLEATDQILGTFDRVLGEYTMRHFVRQRIAVRTESFVSEVRAEEIILKDGTRIPYGWLVWSTGIGPTPFVRSLPFAKDRRSRLIIDGHLRVEGCADVFALGDCATQRDHDLPATAQVAQQQGDYLARAFNRAVRGKPPEPFRYRHFGMLAYVGANRALADLATVKGRGFSAWIFWRSAYLTKLVSLKNKVLVLFDWSKAFIFGRDVSRF